MDALTILNVALVLVNIAVAVFQGWKEWHAHHPEPQPHPLTAPLDDIARAIDDLTDMVRLKEL